MHGSDKAIWVTRAALRTDGYGSDSVYGCVYRKAHPRTQSERPRDGAC